MIQATALTKTYRIARPAEGRFSAIRSLFHTEYEEKRAVDAIDFSIEDGEIVGYIGQNGAGKSTTIKMLSGILVPTSGEVQVNGLIPHVDREAHLKNIGVVFGQKTSLWWDVPVIDSLRILKEMYQVDDQRFKKNLDTFVDLLDLSSFLNQPVRQLSLGQRMRADLAAALMHNPQTLFLDEPTIGVDVVAKERLREFILKINRESGVTTLLTTHDMVDMEKLVNRVIVISSGRIIYDGDIDGLRRRYGQERTVKIQFAGERPSLTLPGTRVEPLGPSQLAVTFNQQDLSVGEIIARVNESAATIRDLTIVEADIEQIVRDIYAEGAGKSGESA